MLQADGNCGPRSAVGLTVYDLQVITDRARDAVVNTNDPHHVYVTHNVNDSSATADTAQLRNLRHRKHRKHKKEWPNS